MSNGVVCLSPDCGFSAEADLRRGADAAAQQPHQPHGAGHGRGGNGGVCVQHAADVGAGVLGTARRVTPDVTEPLCHYWVKNVTVCQGRFATEER